VTVFTEDQFDTFLNKRISSFAGLLIYGSDTGSVSDFAMRVSRRVDPAEPPLRLEARDILTGQADFESEVQAMSLLGGRRTIIVSGITDNFLKHLQPVLQLGALGNFVVLLGGSLNKASKLRQAVEASDRFGSLALYEPKARDLEARFEAILAGYGLKLDDAARMRFFELTGQDRTGLEQEAEKLALYAFGQSVVTAADVEAAGGAEAGSSIDALIDDVLAGGESETERLMLQGEEEGSAVKAALPLFAFYLAQLYEFQAARGSGRSVEAVLQGARPPVHFSRRAAIGSQLKTLDLSTIEELQSLVQAATFTSRQKPSLSQAVIGRMFLSAARKVRSSRRN
jgi:DNA polymerase III subunit delta